MDWRIESGCEGHHSVRQATRRQILTEAIGIKAESARRVGSTWALIIMHMWAMHDTHRIQVNRNAPKAPMTAEDAARIERRLARLEKLLDEGIGAYLAARFPHGDHRTGDRWSRGRRR